MSKVLIVESKVKAKVIQKYLGKEYDVLPSVGHVVDLATKSTGGFGIKVEENFEPIYEVIPEKKPVIKEIQSHLKGAEELILATDPDREGEAIAWHLLNTLKFDGPIYRITFNEVSKDKILEELENKKDIDSFLVEAQQTRRVIDRVVGFKLSKFAKSKAGASSAGRVQSVALKVVCEREDEIDSFIPESWYESAALIGEEQYSIYQKNILVKTDSKSDLEGIVESSRTFVLKSEVERKITVKPPSPLDMVGAISLIQSSLGYSSGSISKILQDLFNKGFITYPRTDSKRFSPEFINKAKNAFSNSGLKFVNPTFKAGSQDAHESIRTIELSDDILNQKSLTPQERNVLGLILKRTRQSMLGSAEKQIKTGVYSNGLVEFKLAKSKYNRLGFKALDDDVVNDYTLSKKIIVDKIEAVERKTSPKPRYSSATLIKYLKDIGVGRPSTYGKIAPTLSKSGYVEVDKNRIKPTSLGRTLSKLLTKHFSKIIDEEYTSKIEETLDDIAHGKNTYLKAMNDFYHPFIELVDKKLELDIKTYSDIDCPKCGSAMLNKSGRYGSYLLCDNELCKHTVNNKKPVPKIEFEICPKCNKNKMVLRKGKRGYFAGCSGYPKCKNIRQLTKEEKENIK